MWGDEICVGRACGVGSGIFFFSHYRVINNNYTYVFYKGIILGDKIAVHPCGRGKSTVCDA